MLSQISSDSSIRGLGNCMNGEVLSKLYSLEWFGQSQASSHEDQNDGEFHSGQNNAFR